MKPLFAIACLLAAFCMSSIQPLLGKMLLPSYGGSNSVWTTAMLFFQSCLLIGYLYSYFLSRFTTPVLACVIHSTLWLLAFLTLPFSTTQFQTESLSKYAALELLINLISHAAFPLTLLGASAPLLQWWFANTKLNTNNGRWCSSVQYHCSWFCSPISIGCRHHIPRNSECIIRC